MHCTISSSGCSSMQGIYGWLTGGPISLLYIYICSVAVCKASVLDWWGVHLPALSIYIICSIVVCKASVLDWLGGPSSFSLYIWSVVVCKASRSSSGCSNIQGIYAQLTGGSRSTSGYMYSRYLFSIDWGGSIYIYLYIYIYVTVTSHWGLAQVH